MHNPNVKGIKLEKEVKLVQFADDTTLFLKDLQSAKEMFVINPGLPKRTNSLTFEKEELFIEI